MSTASLHTAADSSEFDGIASGRPGKWSHDLCDCCGQPYNWKICCQKSCPVIFCGVCQNAKIHSHLQGDDPAKCCSAVPCLCTFAAAISDCFPCYLTYVRIESAKKLGIEEGCCTSCCISTCCVPCSLIQQTDTHEDHGIPVRLQMFEVGADYQEM